LQIKSFLIRNNQQTIKMAEEAKLVIINYNDLLEQSQNAGPHTKTQLASSSLSSQLSQAFGSHPHALGLIAIRNIPAFLSTKQAFLPLAHKLAHLPPSYLEEHLTDEASMYNAGWSHGKENLASSASADGKVRVRPDLHKASFYFNPITDVPGSEEDRRMYPVSYPVNRWPEEEVLPDLERLGKKLGTLMRDAVAVLANHVDAYVREEMEREMEMEMVGSHGGGTGSGATTAAAPSYTISMGKEMKVTEKVKGRLLYYFPLNANDNDNEEKEDDDDDLAQDQANESGDSTNDNEDSWIGWHNDSGFFTALAGDLYVHHDTGRPIPRQYIDPNAGLVVMNRNGDRVKVSIPEDCMAVQIGECLQIVTGGKVVATPHCVRGVDPSWDLDVGGVANEAEEGQRIKSKVARISFPCFVDTVPSFALKVPDGSSRDAVLASSVEGCAKVPPLGERFVE
jgi:hypothetical protein